MKTENVEINVIINGNRVIEYVAPDMVLLDFLRKQGCKGVKRGCETSNCGACTVFLNGKPVLSCSVLAVLADGCEVTTIEGLQKEAEEFGEFLAERGGTQCGFCNPGMVMNTIALFREYDNPTDEEMKEYLAGNLCRCTGYEAQMQALRNFRAWRNKKEADNE